MILKSGAALLFDIDGTLADTDPVHLAAFNQAFAPFGHQFDRARFVRDLQGRANEDIAAHFMPHLPHDERMAVMMAKEALFRDIAATELHAVTGLFELLDLADSWGIPMAAVTNAPRPNADLILGGLGITNRFKAIVIGDELPHSKPHPFPYLEALRLLGADAAATIAFEDSRTGLASAVAAGIVSVGIRTSLSPADMLAAGATISTDSYTDPSVLALIQKLLGA
ncbi:HAD family hydrolase [Devosia submarina]|uniref:HAD family hydrolase n=1 Tax=Devosia submarina TaxID=1173082 RepID=UPI000D3DBDDB|nr:HAD-IA family hydrolase [Devosia submarina]